jgi:hypothetical protein
MAKSLSKTPAPKKDRIFGSDKNKKGSASSKASAKGIDLNDSIIETLSNKAKEYNEKHPNSKVSVITLKAVMRRGMGAYSTSHRPTITGGASNSRQAWGFARVNKFLKKKAGQEVKAAYVQDDDLMEKGGFIAPNGKTSNLTPEQYKLVRTPEFKAWFGDWENDPENASKVVDENGEPLVVYHGTEYKFNEFDINKSKFGFFFTNSYDLALTYDKNVYQFFLDIKKPRKKDFKGANHDGDYQLKDYSVKNIGYDTKTFASISHPNTGYNGAIMKNVMDIGEGGWNENLKPSNIYVVFKSNQIKLADGTNKTFDMNNPDIRYADGGETKKSKDAYTIVGVYKSTNDLGREESEDLTKEGLLGYRLRYNKMPMEYYGYVVYDDSDFGLERAKGDYEKYNRGAAAEKERKKLKDIENKIKREKQKIIDAQKLEAAKSDNSAKPSYLMTISEYQDRVVPLLKEYEKFARKNSEYLSDTSYSGFYKVTFEQVVSRGLEGKKTGYYFRRDNEKELIEDWNERKFRKYDDKTIPKPTPKDVLEKNISFFNDLNKFFDEKVIFDGLKSEYKKSNKPEIRRAIEDDTYKKLLENGEITEEQVIKIAEEHGIKVPKKVFSQESNLKKEAKKQMDEILSKIPQMNQEVFESLYKKLSEDFKDVEKIIIEQETERLEGLIKEYIELSQRDGGVNVEKLKTAIPFWADFFDKYEQIVITGKDYRGYPNIERFFKNLKLQSDYKRTLDKIILDYAESLKYRFLKAVLDNFPMVSKPISNITRENLKVGKKGFEGRYRFNFADGSYFDFVTEAIPAAGYNIVAFHYRYLTHLENATLADGTKVKGYYEIMQNFSSDSMADGGEVALLKVGQILHLRRLPMFKRSGDLGKQREVNKKVVEVISKESWIDEDEANQNNKHKTSYFFKADDNKKYSATFWGNDLISVSNDKVRYEAINDKLSKGGTIDSFKKVKETHLGIDQSFENVEYKYKEATIYYNNVDKLWVLTMQKNGKPQKTIGGYKTLKIAQEVGLYYLNNPNLYADGGQTGQAITCVNCGWHWNTADSDEFDKYICHKCGFDNRTFYDPEPIGKMADGGQVFTENEGLYVIIKNVNEENRYKGAYKKIFDIIEDGVSLYNPYGTDYEKIIDGNKHIFITPRPEPDVIEKIEKIPNVKVLHEKKYMADGGEVILTDDTYQFNGKDRKFKVNEPIFFEFSSSGDKTEALLLKKVDDKKVQIKILKKYTPYRSLKIAGRERASLETRVGFGLGREEFIKGGVGKEVQEGTIKVVSKEKILPIKNYLNINYIPYSEEFKDYINNNYEKKNGYWVEKQYMADGGVLGVPSTENLIELVRKERENKIKEWNRLGYRVVVARNDGYSYEKESERDTEFIDAKNPSERKVADIIKNNPDLLEIRFNGTIKAGNRVGEELEIADDFSVLLWKKDDSFFKEGLKFEFVQDGGKYINTIVNKNDTITYKDRQDDGKYVYFKQLDVKYNTESESRSKKDILKEEFDNKEAIFIKDKYADGGVMGLELFKPSKTIEQIAKEKDVPLDYAEEQLRKGIKIESEHSDNPMVQETIALQHLDEMIDYYEKLEYMESKDKMEKGGVTQFYKEYLDWYKDGVFNEMTIMVSVPNSFSKMSGGENDVILDVFEKKDESVNAKDKMKELLEIVDRNGLDIYLEPIPRLYNIKDKSKREKITKEYLIKYYENFGFELLPNGFMVRKNNKMEKGGYYKAGGEINPDNKAVKDYFSHGSGNVGGVLVGKRHSEGGIKAVNKSTNQPLEMEGGEVVITRNAVSDNTKREFNGEMLTNREILSKINESGGGVSFADGGDIPETISTSGKEYKYGGKMMKDHEIVSSCGCNHSMADGGKVKGKLSAELIHIENAIEYYKNDSLINPTKEQKLNWEIFGLADGIEKIEQKFETTIDEFYGNTKKDIENQYNEKLSSGYYDYLGLNPQIILKYNNKMAEGGEIKDANKLEIGDKIKISEGYQGTFIYEVLSGARKGVRPSEILYQVKIIDSTKPNEYFYIGKVFYKMFTKRMGRFSKVNVLEKGGYMADGGETDYHTEIKNHLFPKVEVEVEVEVEPEMDLIPINEHYVTADDLGLSEGMPMLAVGTIVYSSGGNDQWEVVSFSDDGVNLVNNPKSPLQSKMEDKHLTFEELIKYFKDKAISIKNISTERELEPAIALVKNKLPQKSFAVGGLIDGDEDEDAKIMQSQFGKSNFK